MGSLGGPHLHLIQWLVSRVLLHTVAFLESFVQSGDKALVNDLFDGFWVSLRAVLFL